MQSDYGQTDDTKVDYIKNKPDLSIYAKETDLILATGTENEAPYQIRTAPNDIGNLAFEKLVGLTVCFNQIVANSDKSGTNASTDVRTLDFMIRQLASPYTSQYEKANITSPTILQALFKATFTGKIAVIHNGQNDNIDIGGQNYEVITNHVYFVSINFTGVDTTTLGGVTYDDYNIIDLTAMFGSEVADYLYTLESGTAGAGVSVFKSLFGADFYPYTANVLKSSKPTGKVIKDENDQTIETIVYSGNELRGLIKVGANGLYADGDIDDGSGSTAVRYEERAYQSGDESLANAITDGTNTVVKKATPTTATSTAWSNPIKAAAGGTEEFTDSRTIKMPCGHDTIYSKKTSYRYWG